MQPMTEYLDFARRGRNDWWRYLLAMVLGLGGFVGLGALLVVGLARLGLAPSSLAGELQQPQHPALFFGANGVVFGLLTISVAGAAWLIHGRSPAGIVGRWSGRLFLTGFAVWSGCLGLASLADFLVHPGGFRLTAGAGTPALLAAALVGLGVQTFTEEFIFRGYLTQGLLLAVKRPWIAAILSGLAFGALHIPNGWPQWLSATLFGTLAAMIAIRTSGIAFTFGAHLANNLFGAVVVVSANDVFNGAPGLITQSTPELMWWDVGLGAALLAAVTWLVLRGTKSPAG
jgi:membrane protease YdiL (CAAX protease family)